MRTYEIMFILKPDLPEEENERLVSQMESVVTSTGGTLHRAERMGRRRLAYTIEKNRDGYFVLFVIDCETPTVRELERRLKVSDPVMKYLTVRVDEEIKRLEKTQRIRAQRRARRKPKPAGEAAASSA